MHEPRSPISPAARRGSAWQVWLTALLGLGATAAFVAIAWTFVRDQAAREFEVKANEIVDGIAHDVGALDATTRSFQALLHSVERVDGDQFRAFSDDILLRYPFVTGAAFHPRVRQQDRETFVAAAEAAGVVDILDGVQFEGNKRRLLPADRRAQYYPLLYRDLANEDRTIFGLDIANDGTLADAIDRAVNHGTPVVSRPRPSIDGGADGSREVAVIIATYSGKRVPAQVSDRQDTADGVIVLDVDIETLVGSALIVTPTRPERLRGATAVRARNELRASEAATGSDEEPGRFPVLSRPATLTAWSGHIDLHENYTPSRTSLAAPRILTIADTSPRPTASLNSLHYVRDIALGDRQLGLRLDYELALARMNWLLLVFALLNGVGLTLLVLRVVRSSLLARGMNVLLANKNREIHAINAGLEQTVADRTAALRQATAEVSEMLENLDDAVFIIGKDTRVLERFSPATKALLGLDNPAGTPVHAILGGEFAADDQIYAAHQTALSIAMGGDELQWDMSSPDFVQTVSYRHPQLPTAVALRTFTVKYAPLFDHDGQLERVLVVLSDLTEMLTLRREAAARDDENRRTADILIELLPLSPEDRTRILGDTSQGLSATLETFASLKQPNGHVDGSAIDSMFRRLHTIKGNARMFGLPRLATAAHSAENELAKLRDEEGSVGDVHERLAACAALATRYESIDAEFLRRGTTATGDGSKKLYPYLAALADLASAPVAAATHTQALVALSAALQRGDAVDLSTLLTQYRSMLVEVANRLGKEIDPVAIRGDITNIYLTQDARHAVVEALTHGLRNAIDHGIEPPDVRVQAGKPAAGCLHVEVHQRCDAVELWLCDDGAGIDTRALEQVTTCTPGGDPIELAFAAGVSTKAVANEISGRGVGLDAARVGLRALGGDCTLASNPSAGTTLKLKFPLTLVIAWAKGTRLEQPTASTTAVNRVA